ncbi:hypothetical protein KR038_008561 [Drosophila bunnanda]|nr:hypothetical protein KR038_008561 [Drosophila bunnanda]
MLHNNASWLPPHQQQQQQPPQQQQHPQQPHPPLLQQQQQHPVQHPQQQLYASQMFQQQQQPPATSYWPQEEQQQQQQSLNYNNYFAGQQPLQPPQQQQQLYYPTHQHQLPQAPAETALDSFDNNNSGGGGSSVTSRNDGWGDWGDWNDNNNSTSNGNEPVMETSQEQLLEDSFNVQSSPGSWQAFASNNVELPVQPPAPPSLLPQQQQQQPAPPAPELGQEPELDAIVPPQAFQNQPAAAPPITALPTGPAPPPAIAPPAALPPSIAPAAVLPPSMSPAAGNPFKRSTGLSKRVNILASSTEGGASPSPALAPVAPAVAPMVPSVAPAPADQLFGLPAEAQGEPFSILAALPVAASIGASLPVPAPAPAPVASLYAPPLLLEQPDNQEVLSAPNDERAQYLQTSHLSEQLGEGEADQDAGLLPPPGLSRLVLGQPELDFQQQRLVTGGTEQSSLNVAQAAALQHLEERQADGEDTSDGEQQARNLQTPPRRVVTGVETSVAPVAPLSVREQREVVLDGENLEDREAVSPPPTAELPPIHHVLPADESEQLHHNPQQALTDQQQQSQQPSLQQQQQQPQLEKRAAAGRRGNATSLDLESEDESDEFLASERERDREHARERRDPIDERPRGRGGRGSHYTYDGETEDSVRGGPHSETKSVRDSHHRRSNHDSARSRRHPEPEVDRERERERERDRERDRERERNWRRRSNKYFSGGEDQEQRSYDHPRRGYSNYDGESDNPEMNHLGEGELDASVVSAPVSGGRSSKTGRQRRSEDDYDDYERQTERHYSSRRSTKQHSADKARSGGGGGSGGRRSYDNQGRGSGRLDDSRRSRHNDMRNWDGYEEYRRKSSRNSDLEKERINGGGGSATAGGSGSSKRRNQYEQYASVAGVAYDPYGMYEQMSRNPHAYADMYAKFYGQMINSMTAAVNANASAVPGAAGVGAMLGALVPGAVPAATTNQLVAGGSVSGGSEAALLRERERAAATPGEAAGAAPSTTYGGVTTTAVVARPPRRRTPLLFNRPHLVASYAMSMLLKVKPKYAGRGRIRNDVEVAPLRIRDGTSSLFRMYPGPLQGRKLHKDKIISFCKEQIRQGPTRGCTMLYATQKKPQGSANKYRASHALMWHLLILLLRQNGYIADTDVGDLLLDNQQEYPYDPTEYEAEAEPDADEQQQQQQDGQTQAEKPGLDDSEADSEAGGAGAAPEPTAGAATVDANAAAGEAAGPTTSPLSEQAATDKFRSYVLRGNVEEALQWATDNGLWTHAFFLALYEDRYALTDVAQKFLNRAIKANDPLQTLYQMKSCRTPACVSQLRDEQWGDWRSHLSILVTNKSRQPEYDRSSVVALGDTLFQRGDIYAAHFCYLVAQEEFGRYDSSATELTTLTANVPRLILLGASHYKPFNEFASNEAIIMTEIYEYARSLFDPKFSIAHFQHYKFLLATRILDYGQHFRCTNYLEQIARHIELKPESYDSDFIQRVCGLAERLRYHDPILINRVSFASPPNASSKDAAAPEEKAWLRQLRSLADVPPQQEQLQEQQEQQQQQQQEEIYQQFAEVNKQFRELNMQYRNDIALQQPPPPAEAQPLPEQHQQQPPAPPQQQQQQPQYYEPAPPHAQPETEAYGQQQQPQPPLYYDPNAAAQQPYDQQLLTSNYGQIDTATEAYQGQAPEAAPAAAPVYGFDYWSGTQQPPYGDELQQPQQGRPAISMPKSKSYDDEDDGGQKASARGGSSFDGAGKQQQATAAAGKQANSSGDLGAQPGNQNSGWFGGLWNKLSLKPKNQMILPDDKNPTIVWDKERKCWTNTEGNGEEAESFKPPPKMSDLGVPSMPPGGLGMTVNPPMFSNHQAEPQLLDQSQQQQQQQQQPQQPQMMYGSPIDYTAAPAPEMIPTMPLPASTPAPVAVAGQPTPSPVAAAAIPGGPQPKLQSNMFKMQRNRTLKNSYVDVFNPSGAPMTATPENVLAPIMAPAAVPQGGYFVPGAAPGHQEHQ